MQNPFTYTFGVKPKEYIRNPQIDPLIRNFSYSDPSERSYMITGVRGSGKTVMLTDVAGQISSQSEWYVFDLNPARDMLQSLAAQLYTLPLMASHFTQYKLDLSVLGFGLSVENGTKIFDMEVAIEIMLEVLEKHHKKILITVDEITPDKNAQIFCLTFQRLIRKELPVYMILTGLYNNIHTLKNMNGCTFLQRAPFIVLQPLDLSAIAVKYKHIFHISKEEAISLAGLTNGYAFAFQVLGKLYFEKPAGEDLDSILMDYESELIIYSYNKIWSELSNKDRLILRTIAEHGDRGTIKRKSLMSILGLSSSMMNRYQARLREKGVISTENGYGEYTLTLPCFDSFIKDYHSE